MRILIVKLSSLGDVVHAMPVVHDILAHRPAAVIDWAVEPAFAGLVRRVEGVDRVIECALRRWSGAWWRASTRREWRAFRARLAERRYDAVIDLQGLTKSALIARLAALAPGGLRYGLANRTEGASHEPPARWLVDRAIRIAPRVHALDRSRRLVAAALGYVPDGPPIFGLRGGAAGEGAVAIGRVPDPSDRRTLVLVHGTTRADKLWPEDRWIEFGRRAIAAGWRIALPQAGAEEAARAERIAVALRAGGVGHAVAAVWPTLGLDAVVDRLAPSGGVVGVDSGLSHIAVALGLPHVQVYNWPTAWRTGPLAAHGHRQQVAVEGLRQARLEPEGGSNPCPSGTAVARDAVPAGPVEALAPPPPSDAPAIPSVDAVWSAWQRVAAMDRR